MLRPEERLQSSTSQSTEFRDNAFPRRRGLRPLCELPQEEKQRSMALTDHAFLL